MTIEICRRKCRRFKDDVLIHAVYLLASLIFVRE